MDCMEIEKKETRDTLELFHQTDNRSLLINISSSLCLDFSLFVTFDQDLSFIYEGRAPESARVNLILKNVNIHII